MVTVFIVGTNNYGTGAHGKAVPEKFWPGFANALRSSEVDIKIFENSDSFLAENTKVEFSIIVPVFNESCIAPGPSIQEITGVIDHAKKLSSSTVICNHPDTGIIMGNKLVANRELSAAGVPMPELINSRCNDQIIFSNALVGSGVDVELTNEINPERYNTSFIDTTQTFKNTTYYVSFRAMCIGKHLYSLIIRARPVVEGSPSVHASDTPRDPALINHLYATVALPRMKRIVDLCYSAGERLGFGFYSHDLLPESSSDSVYMCETGFKFHEFSIVDRLKGLEDKLFPNDFMSEKVFSVAAELFLNEAKKIRATLKKS